MAGCCGALLLALCLALSPCSFAALSENTAQAVFGNRQGAFVLLDCASGEGFRFGPVVAAEKLPPCSTFKIWNTLIGLETGLLSSASQPFYHWDGQTRFLPEWNRDLSLKEAFQVSCVPAYQALARQIGPERMQAWLDKLGYGDRDLSAGIDCFWLPAPGRKTLLISPEEQAQEVRKLVAGQLPVSEKSRAVLREMMTARKTDRGVLYGKTGTGGDGAGQNNLGWFVGYVESAKSTYAFACVLKGTPWMGKDARAVAETLLQEQGLL